MCEGVVSQTKYRLVIFDLDGTILNTLEDLADSVNYALTKNKCPNRTIEEVRKFVGNGIHKLIERAVLPETDEGLIEKVYTDFGAYYKEHCADKTRPYDGIVELIECLREKGMLTAVVSNKADFAVRKLCEQYFPGLFDFVVGEREGIRRKPAPDSVLEVLSTLQIAKREVLYVGDSDVDIQTAKNAGLDQISVAWGFRDAAFLRAHGAEYIVKEPGEIFGYTKGRES